MNTSDIDRVLAGLDALAAEDEPLTSPPAVRARVMAVWDQRAADPPAVVLRWWNYLGVAAVSAAVVLLAVLIKPATPSNRAYSAGPSGSEIVLADGSRVEMRAGSELSVDRAVDGIRIRLASGSIIVHAAKQRAGHLYVQTKDMTVSVVGTVFLVNAEEEGSRVAVIEGEVHVQHRTVTQNLRPGEQVLTGAVLEPFIVREQIAWSPRAASLARSLQVASQTAPALPRPEFEVADVHVSLPRPDGRPAVMEGGGAIRGGRFEIVNATLVDLIRTAYGVEADAVVGGPSWLAVDRFDVIARPPATAAGSINAMLQSLLAERFELVARRDTRPMPAWVLSKETGQPKLKRPDGSGEPGCRGVYEIDRLSCRQTTMDEFVAWLRAGPNTTLPLMNSTGLEGSWDFDVDGVDLARTRGVYENSPIIDAVGKQLGLKLERRPIPQPVLVVERVNRKPSDNIAGVETRLPPDPTEFEVASIRPCEFVNPLATGGDIGQRSSPSGLVTTGCQSLAALIKRAWNLCTYAQAMGNVVLPLCDATVAGAPGWMDSKYFNITAKAPIAVGTLAADSKYQTMLRNLLVDRFTITSHYEDRLVEVYTLVATKPRLGNADPSGRTGCRSTGLVFGAPTVVTCQNVTMTQFAAELNRSFALVAGSRGRRVVDETGIHGTWDLTLSYRVAPAAPAEPGVPSTPAGNVSPREALEQQLGLRLEEAKRPLPVFVIDHIEENPTEAAPGQAANAASVPRFEVATIRVNRSGDPRPRHSAVPATGQLTITNITVSELIQDAYDVQLPSQIVNMPDWARSQRVDVVAKAESPAPVAVLQRMLQPLLAEYFKLAVRRETRDMDALALVVAASGRVGPQLRRTDDACAGVVGTSSGFARPPESSDQRGPCGILPGGAGRIVARGLDMAGLADLLATAPRRVVIDRTGLMGRFDIDLTYTPEAFSAAALAQRPGATLPPGVDPSGPPLATALPEQLGLKLESVRAPVEVLVIERAEPLTAPAR